jgi:hypothetical protein
MIRRVAVLLCVAGLLACSQGKTVPYLPGSDLVIPGDGRGEVTLTDALVEPDGPTADADAVTSPDLADGGDGGPVDPIDDQVGDDVDVLPDAGDVEPEDVVPFEPFAACGTGTACIHEQEPLCLLLPDSDEGICVKPCGEGVGQCPPWLECVQPDPQQPDLKVCLDMASFGQPCDHAGGTICEVGTYCIEPPGTQQGICTTFCSPGEAICPVGTTCTLVDPEDPSWGACLMLPDLPACETAEECKENELCAELAPGYHRCAPGCDLAGGPCGTFGTCTATVEVDGTPGNVCITYKEQGTICAQAKGLFCKDGLKCIDFGAPDGWARCLADCFGGLCDPGYVCVQPEDAPKEMCLPLALAVPDATFCNDEYPCPDDDKVCAHGDGKANGICAAPCGEEDKCPAGTSCLGGGCVPAAAPGEPCLETKGIFCLDGALCLTDKGQEDDAGYCATPCPAGDDGPCGGATTCQPVSPTLHACMVAAAFGEPCSLDDGIACDGNAQLSCIHISSDDDTGFCTQTCEGPGSCPQDIPASYAECMIQKAGKWYCAFLCGGGVGGECPGDMTCSGFGMCTP